MWIIESDAAPMVVRPALSITLHLSIAHIKQCTTMRSVFGDNHAEMMKT